MDSIEQDKDNEREEARTELVEALRRVVEAQLGDGAREPAPGSRGPGQGPQPGVASPSRKRGQKAARRVLVLAGELIVGSFGLQIRWCRFGAR